MYVARLKRVIRSMKHTVIELELAGGGHSHKEYLVTRNLWDMVFPAHHVAIQQIRCQRRTFVFLLVCCGLVHLSRSGQA